MICQTQPPQTTLMMTPLSKRNQKQQPQQRGVGVAAEVGGVEEEAEQGEELVVDVAPEVDEGREVGRMETVQAPQPLQLLVLGQLAQ